MSRCDIDLREGMDVRDTEIIVGALRAFTHDHATHPNEVHTHMGNLEHGRGKALVNALNTAVRKNYIEAMIVLFDRDRALHVLQNPIHEKADNRRWRKSVQRHEKGIAFLRQLVDLFENDAHGVNGALGRLLNSEDNLLVAQEIHNLVERVKNALTHEKIVSELESQTLLSATQLKKKI